MSNLIGEDLHDDGLTILDEVSATVAFPPVSGNIAWVADWNRRGDGNEVDEIDLHAWAAGTNAMTDVTLYGGQAKPYTIAGTALDGVTNGDDTLQEGAHGWLDGDGPVQLTTTGTLPAGLSLLTDYFIVVVDAGNIKLATSRQNALEGTTVSLSDDGTGVHTLTGESNCRRMRWMNYGLLGVALDGAINLLIDEGYAVRPKHRPGTIAYSVTGTWGAAVATSFAVYPIKPPR